MNTWKPGINHIEFWVRDLKRSLLFYELILTTVGWHRLGERAFSTGSTEIYFIEKSIRISDSLGPRHICFQATSRGVVDDVGRILSEYPGAIIRGPLEVTEYSEEYYTVDFRDPDGYVLEVAYTPNMKM